MWSANFLGGKKRDEYNEPINAEMGWWESGGEKGDGLKGIVDDIFVGCGGDEILVDSIKIMMGRLEVSLVLLLIFSDWHFPYILGSFHSFISCLF